MLISRSTRTPLARADRRHRGACRDVIRVRDPAWRAAATGSLIQRLPPRDPLLTASA